MCNLHIFKKIEFVRDDRRKMSLNWEQQNANGNTVKNRKLLNLHIFEKIEFIGKDR